MSKDYPDVRIRKVRTLQGRVKEDARDQGFKDEDLVVVTTTINSLPKYHLEKIEGDPLTYLKKLTEKQ